MKQLLLMVTFLCYASISLLAQSKQEDNRPKTNPQSDSISKSSVIDYHEQLNEIFACYISIKNALVYGNELSAAVNAGQLSLNVSAKNLVIISEENKKALNKAAEKIAGLRDLKKQREMFVTLSVNMLALAKVYKLSDGPVYLQYCSIIKAIWLSSDKEIKNPYFGIGNENHNCGVIIETF
jgi:hypothetical protein